MPKITETAELIVNGKIFRDWESIQVRHCLYEQPPFWFRFTCSEPLPLAKNWGVAMQVRPGYACTVRLAGQLAITGFVTTRQVFVDAQRHHIEIKGSTKSHDLANAAAQVDGMQFKDKNFKQIADELIKPTGVKMVVNGKLPDFKFPRYAIRPGATIWECLNELSLIVGASFTSDPDGNFVVEVPDDAKTKSSGSTDSIVEGKNMLDGRELIQQESYGQQVVQHGQTPGTDKDNGSKTSHEPIGEPDGKIDTFSGDRKLPKIGTATQPAWTKAHLQGRANLEKNWQEQDAVTVVVTTHGWLKPSGGLWNAGTGKIVHVKSPMLIMDQDLQVRSVTFIQNNAAGSRTILELMNRMALSQMMPQHQ